MRRAALVVLAALAVAGCAGERGREVPVVVISADSLRVDRLRLWNPDAPTPTPNLERLAALGTTYDNAWATSPWTAPSMVSVFTGLYPPSHGVAYRDDTTPPALPTLPRILEARGYRLGNFSFFAEISYFRNLGLGPVEKGSGHRRLARTFDRWLEKRAPGAKFFAWVHLLETHLPYGASGYRATRVQVPGSSGLEEAQLSATVPVGTVEFAAGDRETLLELYDRDVAAMDRTLGKVLDALETRGLLDETLVVFVADHGEELLDDGWIGHASTAVEAKLLPIILRVPLIVAGPGVPAGAVRDELVQQVDVLPTLLRLLGLEPPDGLDGRLLPGIRDGWRERLRGGRRLAFFDTSPGGNLTPRERRGERLQAVTDGGCLRVTHAVPGEPEAVRHRPVAAAGEPCDGARRETLASALEDWRRGQTEKRLALLARYPGGSAPASAEADGYDERIAVVSPRPGSRLDWRDTGGQVAFEWKKEGAAGTGAAGTGAGNGYWIQYELGSGLRRIEGAFEVEQERVVFGPVPEGFWNDVAGFSPARIRVLDAARRERSAWIEFEVLPVE